MISLTVVVLTLGATFGGIYLVYKLNKKQIPQTVKRPSPRHH
jgi:uncharacterized protein YneF (UPF0154 family)